MSSSDGCQRPDTPSEPAVVLARLRKESTRIKRRELETTVRKLDASGGVSGHERAVLEEMADRIVTRLLEPPTAALEGRECDADPAELEALARLFDLPTERDGTG